MRSILWNSGFLPVFVAAMSGVAHGEVLIDHSVADLWIIAQACACDPLCQQQVQVESLGDTELTCSRGLSVGTADSFASVSMSASLDNTHMSMRFGSVFNVTGFDPTPKSEAPYAGGRGWASLGFSVTDEPMVVTMTIVDIGTDPGPPSVSEMRAYLVLPGTIGGLTSHAGQTTQTGVFTGTLQPGQGGSVYVEFEDVVAYTANPDAFARVALTLDFEPLRCSEPNAASNVAGDVLVWNNLAGGSYSVASNWDPPRVPTHDCSEGDTAVFELVHGPEIFIDAANATAGSWRVLNNLYRIRGPAQLYSDSLTDVSLEISHDGWLSLAESTLGTGHSRIGNLGGSSAGRMTVRVPGTIWDSAGRIHISNGSLTVTEGGEVYTDDLAIGTAQGQTAAVTVSGVAEGTRSRIESATDLTVGQGGTGTLNISAGAHVLAETCAIGLYSDGAVVVGGSSNPDDPFDTSSYATLRADGVLQIGGEGTGSLRIEQGGVAAGNPVSIWNPAPPVSSRLVVDGQGGIAILNALTRLWVNNSSQIEVEAVNGGRIVAEAIGIGGGLSAGTADVTVRGSASQADEQLQSSISTVNFPQTIGGVGAVLVGEDRPGQLNILSGGLANFRGGLVVGDGAQGIVLISGQGAPKGQTSSLQVTGATTIGVNAAGTLQLGDGAIVNMFGDMTVGAGANGSVTLNNNAFLNVNGTLRMGQAGMGTLGAVAGSAVDCTTLVVGGGGLVSNLSFTSSNFHVYGNAQVGSGPGIAQLELNQSSTMFIDGTMTIGGLAVGLVALAGGATIQGSGNIVVNPGGFLDGTGTVALCSVCTINNGGTISPGLSFGPLTAGANNSQPGSVGFIPSGSSPGTLTIEGDFEQLSTGVLMIDCGGPNPGECGVLHVTGATTLGGRLEVHFRSGFSPSDPQAFIQSQSFIQADGGTMGDYAERIYAFPDIFADFDDDGDKDLRDVGDFQNCFGLSGAELVPACERADWERDGVIGGREIQELGARLTGP